MKHISWKDCGEELVTEGWGREGESIDSLVKNMNRDQQAVCVQIFAASILLEIKEDLELLTEPIKEEKRRQAEVRDAEHRLAERGRTKEFGPMGCACAKMLDQYKNSRGIAKVLQIMRGHVEMHIWRGEETYIIPTIKQLLEKPITQWTDIDITRFKGVGKLTVQRFRSEINDLVEVK